MGKLPGVASVSYISAQTALEEFNALSGFGSALQYLDENPLPEAFLVQPLLLNDSAKLVAEIRQIALVDDVQLDMEWLRRLDALLDMGRKLVLALRRGPWYWCNPCGWKYHSAGDPKPSR